MCHLSLEFGARHVLKVVVVASASGVGLHDEMLDVQGAGVGVGLTQRRGQLRWSVVPGGLLREGDGRKDFGWLVEQLPLRLMGTLTDSVL